MAEFQRGLFVRRVREACGLTQEELAERMGVTQSALARFERSQTHLRPGNLERLATALGIAPGFLATGQGNPFVVGESKKMLKLFLNEGQDGKVDASLLIAILEQSQHSVVVFLTPDFTEGKGIQYKRGRMEQIYFAILIRDYEDSLYMFKNKYNNLFDNIYINKQINSIINKHGKCIEVYNARAGRALTESIAKWEHIRLEDCYDVINITRNKEYRKTLRFMINAIWSHAFLVEERVLGNRILEDLKTMTDEEIRQILKTLLPRLAEDIKSCIPQKL